jgi:hypothetical protein
MSPMDMDMSPHPANRHGIYVQTCVLISLGAITKYQRLDDLSSHLFLKVLMDRKSNVKVLADLVSD